jgi:hypothetical protein
MAASPNSTRLHNAEAQAEIENCEVEFKAKEREPYLPEHSSVMANCIKVEKAVPFNVWGETRNRLIFHFDVIEPHACAGTKLKMFAEYKDSWRYLPRSSKIRKLVEIASGTFRISPVIRFNELFRCQIFRCKLSHITSRTVFDRSNKKKHIEPCEPWTVIETITERITRS